MLAKAGLLRSLLDPTRLLGEIQGFLVVENSNPISKDLGWMDAFYFWNDAFSCHVSYEFKADSTPPVDYAQGLTLLQGTQRSKTKRLPSTTMMREDRDQCFKFKFSCDGWR